MSDPKKLRRRAAWMLFAALYSLSAFGCGTKPSSETGPSAQEPNGVMLPANVHAENNLFLKGNNFDPWILSTTDSGRGVDVYLPSQGVGQTYGPLGTATQQYFSGQYENSTILSKTFPSAAVDPKLMYGQSLDMHAGTLNTRSGSSIYIWTSNVARQPWARFWATSDIAISGDPEAQQVTHSNMFYLAGSAVGNQSIPPMGLSSNIYQGHIFWDAEIWMFPALIVQHPDLAYGIVQYRYKRLAQARAIAASHGFKGADYPWESADTGAEVSQTETTQERHITADVAYAAWQYYLWTGDLDYLKSQGWPVIQACAEFWASRVKKGTDGKYHILQVIGPDETAGVVDDDAWTNAIVAETLREAGLAAKAVGSPADPQWAQIADKMALLTDPQTGIYLEHAAQPANLMAKQADTQMLIYPLSLPIAPDTAGKTLDYCIRHTISTGPAMTASIDAIDAARLGRGQQSLDLFHESYRPFMRGPWNAFSEKRTSDRVYFCTGMGGCLQTVLYGFGGLRVVEAPGGIDAAGTAGSKAIGALIARSGDASLYADPHLPPGWTGLTIAGVQFRGHVYDVRIAAGNKITVTKKV